MNTLKKSQKANIIMEYAILLAVLGLVVYFLISIIHTTLFNRILQIVSF